MNSCENEVKKGEKRKKTLNITTEQYELFLSILENDYAFRTGAINPAVDDNYISHKWKELANKLNAISTGPYLTPDEWHSRFIDWKCRTRAKYRKICEHRSQTVSGPQSDISLTEFEERALIAWGEIVNWGKFYCVSGNTNVTQYEGLKLLSTINLENSITSNTTTNNDTINNVTNVNTESNVVYEKKKKISTYNFEDNITLDTNSEDLLNKNVSKEKSSEINKEMSSNKKITVSTNITTTSKKTNRCDGVKPLSLLTEKLIENSAESTKAISEFNNILKTLTENYINLKKEKLEYKKSKLSFEVAKFKFSYPAFEYSDKNI